MVVNPVLDAPSVGESDPLLRAPTPVGFDLALPGRGSTYVTDTAGPAGAPALLLLHGAGCTGLLTWYSSIAPLSRHFRVVTMDQRGHGSGIASPHFSLRDCADDAASVAEELRLGKVIVVGHSMGSLVAQRVWRQHPDAVAGLVLCSTTDRFSSSPRESLFFGMLEGCVKAARLLPPSRPPARGADRLRPEMPSAATTSWMYNEWRQSKPRGVAQAVAACGRHHSAPWLSRVDVPTAVVVTSRDRVITAERQRALASRIPGATVHEVPAGHAACVTAPAEFVPVVVAAAVQTAERAGYAVASPVG